MMSEVYTAIGGPFWDAELTYRRERARAAYQHTGRRIRVPRRRPLRLPHLRPRPAAVA